MRLRLDLPRSPQSALLLSQLGTDHGLADGAVLAGTGLEPATLLDPHAEVSAHQELTIVANLVEAFGPHSGLGLEAGRRYHLTAYGLWGFMVISSPTAREGVEIALRFLDLTFSLCDIHQRPVGEDIALVLEPSSVPTELQRFVVEREAAAIRTIQREASGDLIPLLGVTLAFPAPAEGVERAREIFGLVPEYDAAENLLVFDESRLDQRLPQANEQTAAIMAAECQALLERRQARSGIAGRVRELLVAGIVRDAEPPDSDAVAAALHVSRRTMQRRLTEERTSFRALLEEVREHLAEELLGSGVLSVGEVAQRLGYVEVSSFSQAFRRWKGMGPRAFAQTCRGRTR